MSIPFKATVTFEVDSTTEKSLDSLRHSYSKTLDRLLVSYQCHILVDKKNFHPFEDQDNVFLVFQIERDLTHLKSVLHLSQILQGEAGILSVLPEVYNFRFSILDS